MRRLTPFLLAGIPLAAVLSSASSICAEDEIDLSHFYGFQSIEVVSVENRSANLIHGDFNDDGRLDLAASDNGHSRIDIFLQRKPEDRKPELVTRDVNAFSGSVLFAHQKLIVDKAISDMVAGDFNGDGKTDLAYWGSPDRLVLRLQQAGGKWDRVSMPLEGVTTSTQILAAGVVREPVLSMG